MTQIDMPEIEELEVNYGELGALFGNEIAQQISSKITKELLRIEAQRLELLFKQIDDKETHDH